MFQFLYILIAALLFAETTLQFGDIVMPGLTRTNFPTSPSSYDYTFYRCQQCYHRPTQIYPGWTDSSVISCGIRTLQRYPDSFSFSFDPVSNVCTPGLNTQTSMSSENRIHNMVMCDASKGLQIFTSGNSVSCLGWFPSAVMYGEADDACRSKGGYLMSIKTIDKVNMLRGYVFERAWVGLDDIVQEGVYVWRDDNSNLTAEVKSNIFYSGEPNNNGDREDCNVYSPTLLNDVPCWFNYTYLCEIFTVNIYV